MRQTRSFRPSVGESLEGRCVPSGFGIQHIHSANVTGAVPIQDAAQVAKAFAQFEKTYAQDVKTLVSSTGNAATFTSDVNAALTSLNQSIGTTIGNLSTATTLSATISAQLLGGTGTNSLQNSLNTLTLPSSASNHRKVLTFLLQSDRLIDQTAASVVREVATAPPPSGTIASTTVQTDLGQVKTAFRTFSQTYSTAFQTYLSSLSGSSSSSAATTFASSVQAGLTQLNTSVLAAVSNLPTSLTSTLDTTLTNEVLSSGSSTGSLQANLASLTLPTSARSFSTLAFRIQSNLAIGFAQTKVSADVVSAVQQYNTAL